MDMHVYKYVHLAKKGTVSLKIGEEYTGSFEGKEGKGEMLYLHYNLKNRK